MVNGISAVSSVPPASAGPAPSKAAPAPKSNGPQDSVQLSSTAMKLLNAKTPEALETPAQTEQEASSGDPIALAKLAAQKTQ